MKRPTAAQSLLPILLAVLAVGCYGTYKIHALTEGIERVIRQHEIPMQTISTTTTNLANQSATIVTTKADGENDATWLARHQASVDAYKATGGD